ncbi:MerR family transcriptional regulator [Streptacidiphilus fuscans]|uniref:MerR family transcriptional regulator n=1 Tax=Streptacidiphilus fuscans TaxID=2789292 RepID=UPI002E2B178D|nr:MerR family transcriptional regulator [Streptacidiphilus fuscans]
MPPAELLTIGELAARAGVSVKTVRFWSDRGLLPEADRSSGGHRRYGPEAVERLQLIRSLRGLGVPLPDVSRVLDRDEAGDAADGPVDDSALADVVERQLDELGGQLTALRWREAGLRLLHESAPEQRAERLRLVGGLASPPDTDGVVRYWRRLLPYPLAARLVASITDMAVPQLPEAPTPAQVLAFARLHALTGSASDACLAAHRPVVPRADVLYDGLFEAYLLALDPLLAQRAPHSGAALDCFVDAHARAQDARDTPAFRRTLGRALAAGAEPVMDRYWQLADELSTAPTLGAAYAWLQSALDAELADADAYAS